MSSWSSITVPDLEPLKGSNLYSYLITDSEIKYLANKMAQNSSFTNALGDYFRYTFDQWSREMTCPPTMDLYTKCLCYLQHVTNYKLPDKLLYCEAGLYDFVKYLLLVGAFVSTATEILNRYYERFPAKNPKNQSASTVQNISVTCYAQPQVYYHSGSTTVASTPMMVTPTAPVVSTSTTPSTSQPTPMDVSSSSSSMDVVVDEYAYQIEDLDENEFLDYIHQDLNLHKESGIKCLLNTFADGVFTLDVMKEKPEILFIIMFYLHMTKSDLSGNIKFTNKIYNISNVKGAYQSLMSGYIMENIHKFFKLSNQEDMIVSMNANKSVFCEFLLKIGKITGEKKEQLMLSPIFSSKKYFSSLTSSELEQLIDYFTEEKIGERNSSLMTTEEFGTKVYDRFSQKEAITPPSAPTGSTKTELEKYVEKIIKGVRNQAIYGILMAHGIDDKETLSDITKAELVELGLTLGEATKILKGLK